jgi:hypothetical protein
MGVLGLAAALALLPAGTPVDDGGAVRAGHPRLLLDPARVAELRERLDTTHRFLWERYLQDLAGGRALADVRAERRSGRLTIRFTEEGRTTMVDWDLSRKQVSVAPGRP